MRPVGAELFLADRLTHRQTDGWTGRQADRRAGGQAGRQAGRQAGMTKLTVAFNNFANATKNLSVLKITQVNII